MLVRDVMTADPVTVTPVTDLAAARATLASVGITSMPVVDEGGRLCGIVSEADLILEIPDDPRAHERPIEIRSVVPPRRVDDVYTRSPLTVRPLDDVTAAVDLMTAHGFKSLPVVDDDHHLAGMVSRSDVVRALARDDDDIAADIGRILHDLGHHDWTVSVRLGSVEIAGPSDTGQRSVAYAVSRTVPGVVGVQVV